MLLFPLVSLFLGYYSIFAAPSPSSNHTSDGPGDNGLHENDRYDVNRLSQVYFGRLQEFTLPDADRFERLVAVLESNLPEDQDSRENHKFRSCLDQLFSDDLFEEFQTLYPLIRFDDSYPYDFADDVDLMLFCLDDERAHFGEFMLTQDFDIERFIDAVKYRIGEAGDPDSIIDVIEWLAERNAEIAEEKPEIYRDFIRSTLENWEINDKEKMEVVQRLVSLGAITDENLFVEMDDIMLNCGQPEHIVDIHEWLATVDDYFAEHKANSYQHWILALADNNNIREKDCIKLIRRLVELGATVDDEVMSECRRAFPDEEDLHQYLREMGEEEIKDPGCD
jgi:hypothetical protein